MPIVVETLVVIPKPAPHSPEAGGGYMPRGVLTYTGRLALAAKDAGNTLQLVSSWTMLPGYSYLFGSLSLVIVSSTTGSLGFAQYIGQLEFINARHESEDGDREIYLLGGTGGVAGATAIPTYTWTPAGIPVGVIAHPPGLETTVNLTLPNLSGDAEVICTAYLRVAFYMLDRKQATQQPPNIPVIQLVQVPTGGPIIGALI